MPLFAIVHCDSDGLHSSSCTVIAATSALAIARNILAHPDHWHATLLYAYPNDGDPRSIWQRIQADSFEPEALIEFINQTTLDTLSGEMLRIYPIEIQTLDGFQLNSRWSSSATAGSLAMSSPSQNTQPDTLFSQLAQDARSLLSTPEFQEYIENLLNQNIWQHSELRSLRLITSDLSTWQLPSLGFPLKISNIQKGQGSRSSGYQLNALPPDLHIDICFGRWNQKLKIPMYEEAVAFSEADELEQRWLVVGTCFKDIIGQSEFLISPEVMPQQQSKLVLELTCLVSYIVELLVFKDVASS